MARGTQILPTVDWHRPSDPNQPWGAQSEDSDIMRHSFNNADDGTPAFDQNGDYIMAQQQAITVTIGGVTKVVTQTVELTVKGSEIVSPGGQVQTPYQKKDFAFVIAYYQAV